MLNQILQREFRDVLLRPGTYACGEILVMYDDGTVGALGGTGSACCIAGYAGVAISQTEQGQSLLCVGPVGVQNDGVSPIRQADVSSDASSVYLSGSGDAQLVSSASSAGSVSVSGCLRGFTADGHVVIQCG